MIRPRPRFKQTQSTGHSTFCLLNGPHIEWWPAQLTQAKKNLQARLIGQSQWVLRRKLDRLILASYGAEKVHYLCAHRDYSCEIQAGLALLRRLPSLTAPTSAVTVAQPLSQRTLMRRIGLDEQTYQRDRGLPRIAEPSQLYYAGRDRYQRPIWMTWVAGRAWQRMAAHALQHHITLEVVSSYRSYDYQLGLIMQKLARAQPLDAILRINAAPGFSEHHSGCALDLSTPGTDAVSEHFEQTPAFQWLNQHAYRFGFSLSYPRNNPHGLIYEPWHWCWRPPKSVAAPVSIAATMTQNSN